jgi:hypothetical protein
MPAAAAIAGNDIGYDIERFPSEITETIGVRGEHLGRATLLNGVSLAGGSDCGHLSATAMS